MLRTLLLALAATLFIQPVHAQVEGFGEVDLTEDAPTPTLKVVDLAIGAGVHQRTLQGQAERFPARGQRLWGHVTLANSGPPTFVTMVWKHEGKARWRIDLRVGESPAWRTWSRYTMKPLRDLGHWEVEVLDATGRSLAVTQFIVAPLTDGGQAMHVGPFDDPGC
jgi:hypothetical protein